MSKPYLERARRVAQAPEAPHPDWAQLYIYPDILLSLILLRYCS